MSSPEKGGQTAQRPRFHLAFPVDSLAKARAFYGTIIGCPEGRSSETWVDFNFYGHQIVAHSPLMNATRSPQAGLMARPSPCAITAC
tara:strand:+ start:944 stop:1204 length:261 start_codon:yes stop_codon:yes gene_type:complete